MKKLYVGKVDTKFEISKEQIEKYNLEEGSVIAYSGMAGSIVVSGDAKVEEIDIKEIQRKEAKSSVDIKEVESNYTDIKEVEEVDIKEI